MNEIEFKKKYKYPACTKNPFERLIPFRERKQTLREIKQQSLEKYGEDLSSECTKRKVCIGKTCLGRPLPDVEAAKPYLESISKLGTIINNELFIKTDCTNCPIKQKCSYSCSTINDFINRNKTEEPIIFLNNNEPNNTIVLEDTQVDNEFTNNEIPWDVLSSKKQEIVRLYVYKQQDFKFIADKLGYNNQAEVKYILYSSLNKLSEFGVIRKFLTETINELSSLQISILQKVYLENKTLVIAAKELKISKQSISNILKYLVDKYDIQWKKYVSKKNNKIVYLVPELMK